MMAKRDLKTAMRRGIACRCPRCGIGRTFKYATTVNENCANCELDFTDQRADDLPAYIMLCVLAPLITLGALAVEVIFQPSLWIHVVLWLPITVLIAYLLLPPVKGLIIAVQWANHMHGFGDLNES